MFAVFVPQDDFVADGLFKQLERIEFDDMLLPMAWSISVSLPKSCHEGVIPDHRIRFPACWTSCIISRARWSDKMIHTGTGYANVLPRFTGFSI